MLLSQRKFCFVSAGLVLICLAALGGWLQGGRAELLAAAHGAEDQNRTQAGSNERLRALLQERYDILKGIVESQKKWLEFGRLDPAALKDATVAMYHAEADLCQTDAERIKVFEKLVTALQDYEAWLKRQAAAGRATEIGVDQAKVARLEAQIRVEQLRLAQKPS